MNNLHTTDSVPSSLYSLSKGLCISTFTTDYNVFNFIRFTNYFSLESVMFFLILISQDAVMAQWKKSPPGRYKCTLVLHSDMPTPPQTRFPWQQRPIDTPRSFVTEDQLVVTFIFLFSDFHSLIKEWVEWLLTKGDRIEGYILITWKFSHHLEWQGHSPSS